MVGSEEARREIAMAKLLALALVLMAAIPLLIGAVIFAPVIIGLALLCLAIEAPDHQ